MKAFLPFLTLLGWTTRATKIMCDPLEYGAKGDNRTVDTLAINAAIANVTCDVVVFASNLSFIR